jgi:hypothetical protein
LLERLKSILQSLLVKAWPDFFGLGHLRQRTPSFSEGLGAKTKFLSQSRAEAFACGDHIDSSRNESLTARGKKFEIKHARLYLRRHWAGACQFRRSIALQTPSKKTGISL